MLEKPFTSLKRPSPTAATYNFILLFHFSFRLLCAKNLKIPLENYWVLWFPPNYSDHCFGQLLVFGVCNFIRTLFLILSANDGDMGKKVDLEGHLASVLT